MALPFDTTSAAPIRRQASSDTACLLLHGLTGAPVRDLWFLADYLSARDISVVAPLLTGHGKTWKELELATAESWQHDAVAGLDEARTMGKTLFVAGLSMGGTLTLYLGEHRPEIAGLITINAPVYVDDPKMRLVPILRHFQKTQPKGPPDVADQDAMLPDLGFNSLEAVYQFERLMQGVRGDLGMVTQPLLAFRSAQDHVVPPRNAEYILEHVNSSFKSVITLEHSYHCATIDYDRERIAADIEQFITLVQKQQV
ncbi:MAG: alpha/beta hydrolase [Candidatus Cryosericum sp.]